MSKTNSGLLLIVAGVAMNVAGQMLGSVQLPLPWALAYPLTGLLVFASLVVGLFGVFRLFVGQFSPEKRVKPEEDRPPAEGVWPPAPKPPGAA